MKNSYTDDYIRNQYRRAALYHELQGDATEAVWIYMLLGDTEKIKHFIRKFANSKSKYKATIWICQTYLTRTKAACPSRRISEKVLFPILAGVLGGQEENVMDEAYRIEEIVVYPEGRLIIRVDGAVVERNWENPSRALSWTDEMKQEAMRKEGERQECLKHHG